jgi:hypothetical protein
MKFSEEGGKIYSSQWFVDLLFLELIFVELFCILIITNLLKRLEGFGP